MKSVGKKAKRIALLFSAAEIACEVQPDSCEDIPDITAKDYIFTDGYVHIVAPVPFVHSLLSTRSCFGSLKSPEFSETGCSSKDIDGLGDTDSEISTAVDLFPRH